MRVLITTDTIGGVWTMTRELTEALLNAGHAVALVSFGRLPSNAQQRACDELSAQHGERFLYRASDVPLEWMQSNQNTMACGAPVMLDTIERFRPHIVHANQFCWGSLPFGVPCIITAHSDVLSWADACRPEGLEPSPWLDCYRTLVQNGLNHAAAIVSPTPWMQSALARHFAVPCPALVIANGRSAPQLHPHVERKLQAISVGRLWDEAKGVQTLLQVESTMPILLAGEDRSEDVAAHTGHLQALGVLDETELTQVFQQSAVYLATSLYEPFGLAPLEAALCGCAVLARTLPSLQQVWGDAALYFEDAASLQSMLNQLSGDATLLRAMQHKASTRAQHFSAQRMADQYLALFHSLSAAEKAPHLSQQQGAFDAAA